MSKSKGSDSQDFFSRSYDLRTGSETKSHYRDWASSYDDEVSRRSGYAQPDRVARTLLSLNLPFESRIFDAGCGSGLSGLAFSAAGYTHIEGCDFSPEMLTHARSKNCYISLQEMDLNLPLDLDDSTYDIVTAVGVFSFGHIQPDACDEFLRILKPQGYLIIALNEKYWDEGQLKSKIESLQSQNKLDILSTDYGEHMPKQKIQGWVIATQKR